LTERAIQANISIFFRKRIQGIEKNLCRPTEGILLISWFDEKDSMKSSVEKMEQVSNEKLEFWPREEVRDHYLSNRYRNAFSTPKVTLIHHQDVICGVAFDRSSLRSITYTPQSSLLSALHLTPSWCPGTAQILHEC